MSRDRDVESMEIMDLSYLILSKVNELRCREEGEKEHRVLQKIFLLFVQTR